MSIIILTVKIVCQLKLAVFKSIVHSQREGRIREKGGNCLVCEIEKVTLNNSNISNLGRLILIVGTLEVNSVNILKPETMSFDLVCTELNTVH